MPHTWTHIPIMVNQIADLLLQNPNGMYIDGTLGLGGHTHHFLMRLSSRACIFGFDKDEEALQLARERVADSRLLTFHASYTQAPEILHQTGINEVDGLLLDLGLSSYQLDNPARGFSLLQNGPLDMRFDISAKLTAADIVNTWSFEDLEKILLQYGEERNAAKIALAIMKTRKEHVIKTTEELKEIVESVVPRYGKKHPATQTFQALRIACNEELSTVETGLKVLPPLIRCGGRIAILTFHSLEDRLVKTHFKQLVQTGNWQLVNKHALSAPYAEVCQNHRARSAKLRVIERIS
ncbi:MAG: 16S rRNA (cytosine(1402)-N(4))-methyltransferase RsmH [Elusimicrobiaceae bacterium]|nr:16S rRNA (cytosine(1402)-N(4))-methyltransferase RsmH [Elusimicrobiaceae bacterium]